MTAALLPDIADLIDVAAPFTHTGDVWGYDPDRDLDQYEPPAGALTRLVLPAPVEDPAVHITNGETP